MLEEITKQVEAIKRLADELAGVLAEGQAARIVAEGTAVLLRPEWMRQPMVADGPDPLFGLRYVDWLALRDDPGFQHCWRENEAGSVRSKVFIHVGRAAKYLESIADAQAKARLAPDAHERWAKRRGEKAEILKS